MFPSYVNDSHIIVEFSFTTTYIYQFTLPSFLVQQLQQLQLVTGQMHTLIMSFTMPPLWQHQSQLL